MNTNRLETRLMQMPVEKLKSFISHYETLLSREQMPYKARKLVVWQVKRLKEEKLRRSQKRRVNLPALDKQAIEAAKLSFSV